MKGIHTTNSSRHAVALSAPILFVLTLLIGHVAQAATPNLTQSHYRWRNDDGTEVTATSKAAEDTSIAPALLGQSERLRIEVSNEGTASSSQKFRLQFSTDPDPVNGNWTNLSDQDCGPSICSTYAWESQLVSGAATTNVAGVLTDENLSFQPGLQFASGDPGYPSPHISLDTSKFTELEFSIKADVNVAQYNITYYFRLATTSDGVIMHPLDTYDHVPSVTYFAASNLTQSHYHWKNDNGDEGTLNENPATSASFLGQDDPVAGIPFDTIKRLRLEVSNEGNGSSSARYELQFSTASTTGWATVPISASCGTSAICMAQSVWLIEGAATENYNSAGNGGMTDENTTFVLGQQKETNATTTAITLGTTNFTELEYSIKPTTYASYGTNYFFRLVTTTGIGDATPLDTYGATVKMTTKTIYDWTERQPAGDNDKQWQDVASDSDGSNLIAGVYGGRLYTSSDGGVNWTERQPAGAADKVWMTVSSDADGSNLIAGVQGGRLYTSSNGGVSWTERQPAGAVNLSWWTTDSDDDGTNLIAGVLGGRLYTSSDGGVNWTERQPFGNQDRYWGTVASDADGSNLVAGVFGGKIYTSSNGGVSWTEHEPAGAIYTEWRSSASDSDGSNLIVGYDDDGGGGRLYTSSDGGTNWVERQPAGSVVRAWYSVASDSTGTRLAAAVGLGGGRLYTSSNSGLTWAEEQPAGNVDRYWYTIASDSTGSHLIAAANQNNRLYTAFGDAIAPTITNISSDKTNSSYKAGEVIDIDVTFSEAVTSTGTVTVTLETGATDRTCAFTVSNSTTGTCNYTVQAGDTSSDLTVNTISGTIADQTANSMTDFSPATNLAANKALVIDTAAPTIAAHTTVAAETTSISGTTVTYTSPATTDDQDSPGTASCTPASGANFAIGSTTVTCTASDSSGNAATPTTFTVTVTQKHIGGGGVFLGPIVFPGSSQPPSQNPSGGQVSIVTGNLIKYASGPGVYQIIDGVKHLIPDEATFLLLGFKWSDIKVIPGSTVFSNGTSLGTTKAIQKIIRVPHGHQIYIVRNGTKYHVLNKKTLTDLGFSFKDVIEVSNLDSYRTGMPIGQ